MGSVKSFVSQLKKTLLSVYVNNWLVWGLSITTDKELLQNGQFLIPNTPQLLAMVLRTRVSIHPMQTRLYVTINVTAWQGLGLDVGRALLAINVEEYDNGPPFMCGSNALPNLMVDNKVVPLVQSMCRDGWSQHCRLVVSKHVSRSIQKNTQSTQLVALC